VPGVLFITALLGVLVLARTQVGRDLSERLAQRLARLTPAHLVLLLLTASAATALLAWLKTDGAFMLARAVPEGVAWFGAFDIGLFVDGFALALVVGAILRLRATWQAVRMAAAGVKAWSRQLTTAVAARLGPRPSSRERRSTPSRARRRTRDKDDPTLGLAFA
jgi:hypothetical protein